MRQPMSDIWYYIGKFCQSLSGCLDPCLLLHKAMLPVGKGSAAFARANRAFSLLEMLITLVLVIIMFVMLYGRGAAGQQLRRKQNCQQNLQNMYVALQVFATEHNEMLPTALGATTSEPALGQLVPRYTSTSVPFICPASSDSRLPEGEPIGERKISYAYYMGRRISDASEVLVSDAQVNTLAKQKGDLEMSNAKAPFPLPLTNGIVLLNPKP